MLKRSLTAGLAVFLLILGAPVAVARVTNLIPADLATDTPEDSFTTDMGLEAIYQADIKGANICIVGPLVSDPGDGSLTCKSAIWGSANQVLGGGGTQFTPVEPPPLRLGTYRLLADGGFDDTEADALSFPFTVSPCDACDPAPAASIFNEWKASAAETADRGDVSCALFNTDGKTNAKDLAKQVATGIQSGTPTVLVLVSAAGGYAFASLIDEAPQVAMLDKWLGVLHAVTCRATAMFRDIANDPPDPNYALLTAPVPAHIPILTDAAVNRLALGLDQLAAAGNAELLAVQRYEGAQQADDPEWMGKQATAAAAQGYVMADLMRDLSAQTDAFADRLQGAGVGTSALSQSGLDAARAFAQRVHDTGFTLDEQNAIAAAQADFPEIDMGELRQLIGNEPLAGAVAGKTLPGALHAFADSLLAQADHQEQMASAMADVAPRQAPAAVKAVITTPSAFQHLSPYPGRFSGETSRGGSKPVASYHWDFGDGTTDDGITTTHLFSDVGSHDVALTVTDGDGASDTAHIDVETIARSTLLLPNCHDSNGDQQFNCPGYDTLPTGGALTVAGSGPETLTVNHTDHNGAFQNGLFWFPTDDGHGRVDGLAPGEDGWMAAAIGRSHELFPPGDPTPKQVTLDVHGGDHVAFGLTSNQSLLQAIASDPTNRVQGAFELPFAAANLGGVEQVLPYRRQSDGAIELGFEDIPGGGDNYVDDILVVSGAAIKASAGIGVTIHADTAQVPAGADDGYQVKISGDGLDAILDSITATLPEGFSYVPGSTRGATTANPQQSGRTLTWAGRFGLPGNGLAGVHFAVKASPTAGTYEAEATADARGVPLSPSGPSAPIEVTATPPSAEPPPSEPPPTPGPAPPPPASQPLVQHVPITQIVTLPSAKRCLSRRRFRIHLRNHGLHPLDATVVVNGHKLKVVSGRRLASDVDLRGLPKGKVVVRITIRYREGKTLTGTRTYHTCVARRKTKHKHGV